MKLRKLVAILLIPLIISTLNFCSSKDLQAWTISKTRDSEGSSDFIEGSYSILGLISVINKYLWFAIGFFCFVFMIYNGYKLIAANGNDKATDSAKKALLGSVIGLAVCLLAYIIVNLAVKLFQ